MQFNELGGTQVRSVGDFSEKPAIPSATKERTLSSSLSLPRPRRSSVPVKPILEMPVRIPGNKTTSDDSIESKVAGGIKDMDHKLKDQHKKLSELTSDMLRLEAENKALLTKLQTAQAVLFKNEQFNRDLTHKIDILEKTL